MMPPGVEHCRNSSTFNRLCACGCGASIRSGQRWREPACKARAYRAGQQADYEDMAKEAADEQRQAHRHMIELGRKLKALEQAYSQLWEEHQDCHAAPLLDAPQWSGAGDAYAVLGVRPDAESEAIEGGYKALAKKYHPDRNPGDPVMDARIKAITTAYAEVLRLRAGRRKRR
jgi:DnaJ-domain-containing protein 1